MWCFRTRLHPASLACGVICSVKVGGGGGLLTTRSLRLNVKICSMTYSPFQLLTQRSRPGALYQSSSSHVHHREFFPALISFFLWQSLLLLSSMKSLRLALFPPPAYDRIPQEAFLLCRISNKDTEISIYVYSHSPSLMMPPLNLVQCTHQLPQLCSQVQHPRMLRSHIQHIFWLGLCENIFSPRGS